MQQKRGADKVLPEQGNDSHKDVPPPSHEIKVIMETNLLARMNVRHWNVLP